MGRGKLPNLFSWSSSRSKVLAECERRYFWSYYGSWGGWERGAATETRAAYLLKKLTGRYGWAGDIAHEAIKIGILEARRGRTREVDQLVAWARDTMRAEFKYSKNTKRDAKNGRGFFGLLEHEYGEQLPQAEWVAIWERTEAAIRTWYAGPWLQLARELGAGERWIAVDELDFEQSVFELRGVRVFAVPDWAHRNADGTAVVSDWKTGKPKAADRDQVYGYGLFLENRFGIDALRVRVQLVYLGAGGTVVDQVVEPIRLEEYEERFWESVRRMRELLADVPSNTPKPREAFAMAPPSACRFCEYRRLCGREKA